MHATFLRVHALKSRTRACYGTQFPLGPFGGVACPILTTQAGRNLPPGAQSWLRQFVLPLWQRELHLRFALTRSAPKVRFL